MRLESARDLKSSLLDAFQAQLLPKGSPQLIGRTPFRMSYAMMPEAAGVRSARSPAVGIARRGKGREGYGVAVRVPLGVGREVVSHNKLVAKYSDEVDVRFVDYSARITVRACGSCGHPKITAGTLGGFVEDEDYYYILSNNHVLANCDKAARGDPIWQPGPSDLNGKKPQVIGYLERWSPLARGVCDAAIARLGGDCTDFYPWDYRGIGEMDPRPFTDRYAVETVTKRGLTTDITEGEVSAYELDGVVIDYGTRRRPYLVTFDNQVEFVGTPPTKPFSQPGDSGSFILDLPTLRPYALLYAGGPDADGIDRTIGTFMPDVLDELGVRMIRA